MLVAKQVLDETDRRRFDIPVLAHAASALVLHGAHLD